MKRNIHTLSRVSERASERVSEAAAVQSRHCASAWPQPPKLSVSHPCRQQQEAAAATVFRFAQHSEYPWPLYYSLTTVFSGVCTKQAGSIRGYPRCWWCAEWTNTGTHTYKTHLTWQQSAATVHSSSCLLSLSSFFSFNTIILPESLFRFLGCTLVYKHVWVCMCFLSWYSYTCGDLIWEMPSQRRRLCPCGTFCSSQRNGKV